MADLFEEELKDRENNSFQEIGSTLRILTWLLRKYNAAHKYDHLLKWAKNANFDCACGYDAEDAMEEGARPVMRMPALITPWKIKFPHTNILFPRATSQVAACRHLATAARVKYLAALQRCKFDTPLLAARSLI